MRIVWLYYLSILNTQRRLPFDKLLSKTRCKLNRKWAHNLCDMLYNIMLHFSHDLVYVRLVDNFWSDMQFARHTLVCFNDRYGCHLYCEHVTFIIELKCYIDP